MFNDFAAPERPVRDAAVRVAKVVGGLIVVAVVTQVSWNMFAPDVFGLEPLRMRATLGLVTFAAMVASGVRFAVGGGYRV